MGLGKWGLVVCFVGVVLELFLLWRVVGDGIVLFFVVLVFEGGKYLEFRI